MQNGLGRGKGFAFTSVYTRYVELGGTKSKRALIDNLKTQFGSNINIVKPKRANESSIIIPALSKDEAVQNYVETASTSHTSTSLFSGISELSVLHKIFSDIGTEIDNIPDYYNNLSTETYKQQIMLFTSDNNLK